MDPSTAYVWGVAACLAGAALHAAANLLDSHLSHRLRGRLVDLVALSAGLNLLFLPLIVGIDPPQWLHGRAVALVALISLINVTYHFPYYRALQDSDTSVVSSLFSIGKIVTPFFAFILVRERLTGVQYAGFVLIIVATALLTFDRARLRFRIALLYMLGVSVALVLQAVLFKMLYDDGVSWGTSVVWTGLVDFAIAAVFSLSRRPKGRREHVTGSKRVLLLVLVAEFLSWGGEIVGLYALTLVPVSVFEGVGSTQPFFVLLLAAAGGRRLSRLVKEDLAPRLIRAKAALFVLTAVGTVMVVRHG